MAKTLADLVREAQTRVRAISVEEFNEMIENHDDALVVDVRQGRRASKPGRTFFGSGFSLSFRAFRLHVGVVAWNMQKFYLSRKQSPTIRNPPLARLRHSIAARLHTSCDCPRITGTDRNPGVETTSARRRAPAPRTREVAHPQ